MPPTYTFVMSSAGAFPDLQPAGGTGSMYASSGADAGERVRRDGLFLHGEQHFTYHRPVSVGDVLEGRMRTSKPIARQARRGPMEVTYFQTTVDRPRRPARGRRAHRVALLPQRLTAATSLHSRRSGSTRGSGSNPTD